jgi:hypothetical protein
MSPAERKVFEQKNKRERRTAEQRQREWEEGRRQADRDKLGRLDRAYAVNEFLAKKLAQDDLKALAEMLGEDALSDFIPMLRRRHALDTRGYRHTDLDAERTRLRIVVENWDGKRAVSPVSRFWRADRRWA